ncbi:5-methyltetrahydropteroyltriglutamate--homocysteine S-methyltransferase [Jiangella sp. DSM 45060]|uniref:5-methyltetrahydropteroyltriglutamate-- homocysteine S-methyltransferase n=1 Tax=Jiangella sp. DSM 45060 TaxID=1798224 RepID=UPI00087CA398|nr:5-methyltetrahydropteroyltriglutamate--homocysteine S-methyltransferase [Jiangella sp. DSM 45060]SDS27057.1 methionine synthase (B12-independent) [Jiangella sp. DSM 45060]
MTRPTPALTATVPGYPRIGPDRELKRALEAYWSGDSDRDDLEATARAERERTWLRLAALGLDAVPSNTFSLYDQVLDAVALTGAVPPRFTSLGLDGLGTYFAMARGADGVAPLELTKWFDTNYHYLVPEIGPATRLHLDPAKPVREYREALALGLETRPVLLGPASFLLLSKPADGAPGGFAPLDRLDDLVAVYALLLATLADEGVAWVQLDEPAYVADRTDAELDALRRVYARLGELPDRPAILVSSYFGDLGDALPVLASSPVEAIGLDLVAGELPAGDVDGLDGKIVVAGVVDGRNVWRTDLDAALATLRAVEARAGAVAVGTSCSLLHVPYDLDAETALDSQLRSWLAFADQKVAEVVTLATALRDGTRPPAFDEAAAALADRAAAPRVVDDGVRTRLAGLTADDARRGPYERRADAQRDRLGLPPLPTTTIGSFPQTGDIRRARADHRAGRLDRDEYAARMRAEIERVVRLQERLGLDVLVHGEPERNDMVQYFAENLAGFVTTEHGWVQSYGSRCVRPPILYGDVSRPAPITVEWATYAQSLTERPVKGMLTGPVTILAWSFVRDDQPLGDTARQVALALRDEVGDLEAAGVGIVQVDEPALRELLPLRAAARPDYLDWSVTAFRLATSGVADATQVHTHLCYSEFGDVVAAIDGLDADVTSIEAARSRMEIVPDVAASGFGRGIGPGVYDIHSPRVPGADEVEALLRRALADIPGERLWVNPDCGLKTRTYEQVEPALTALVEAAWRVR